MLKRAIGFLLFLAIVAVLGFNFKRILTFGQAHEIKQSAQKAVDAENWEKAIQLYLAGQKQYPDNAAISQRLAWLYRKSNQPKLAESTYKAILKREPDNQDARVGLALLLEDEPGRINEAIIELRKAVKAHPNDARLLSQVGNLYKDAAENPAETRDETIKWLYGQACYYYQAALKINPRQFSTQFSLGVVEQKLNNLETSAKAYCQAVVLKPDSYEAHYNLGLVLSDLDYLQEAYRQMDRAIKILSEKGEIDTAQGLALKVQTVKNKVFNSGRQGLSSHQDPPFLEKACLTPAVVESGTSPGK